MDTEDRNARSAPENKDAPAKDAAANDAPAKDPAANDADDRQAFRWAIVAAMAEFRSSSPRPRSLPRISATPSSADREAHRRAFAVLLQVPLEEVTDARLDEHIAALRRSAEADADALVIYLDNWLKHFQAIGCPCSQIANYFRLARQTLASLYFAAARPTPSPTEVKLLALRYALDARQPAQGPPDRFLLKRCDQYWEVRAQPEMALPELPYPPQVVRDPFAVRLLDLMFRGRWEPYPLAELIEFLLGGQPTRADALPPERQPRFAYQVAKDQRDEPRVSLWIGQTEVKLPPRRDVHALLEALCADPDSTWTGPQCRRQLGISNASEACSLIRQALEKTHPGASQWLATKPIRWAPDMAPGLRPGRAPASTHPSSARRG